MSEPLRAIDFAGHVPSETSVRLAEIVQESPAARDVLADQLRAILDAMEQMKATAEEWLDRLEKLGAASS